MNELIVRIAARGDGVTSSGRHVPFGVPGDALLDDGALAPGAHHQEPPCALFPRCGGCQLQQADDFAYLGYLVSRIETALASHGLAPKIREPHLSPPNSRRRATLHAQNLGGRTLIGFHEEKSHRIVDMRECHILRPELFALVGPLRSVLHAMLVQKRTAQAQITLIDHGVDVQLSGVSADDLSAIERLTSFAAQNKLSRLSLDHGLGPETIYEPVPSQVTLSGVPVDFPLGAFLQATDDGEDALVAAVSEGLLGSRSIADLFCGIGTFTIPLHVTYAAEASRDAVAALKRAAPDTRVEHRDLYRRALDLRELGEFDAVVLDPPRAGAQAQVLALAGSDVSRIAYVSCNPASFARDAKMLADGGYKLEWVKPVGQFRWSTHVELVGIFSRQRS